MMFLNLFSDFCVIFVIFKKEVLAEVSVFSILILFLFFYLLPVSPPAIQFLPPWAK